MSQNEETIVLTREQLFERVWTTAMRNLAPELGVSDVGLKKICKRFGVPTPPVGYWAKKEHGKAPKRPRLPAIDSDDPIEIKFFPTETRAKTSVSDAVDAAADREKAGERKIVVPHELTDPLPLIEKTWKSLQAARPDEEGLVRPRAKKTLDIRVSPDNIDRALRIMNTLLRSLEERDLPPQIVPENERWMTAIDVLDEQVVFGLYEFVERQEREPTRAEREDMERWSWHRNDRFYRHVPTGRLCLAIHSGPANGRRRRFVDSKRRPVESLLNAFIATVYRTAEDMKVECARLEQLQRDREEAERRRQEFERQRVQKLQQIRQEEERVAALVAEADARTKSETLRRYICAVHEMLVKHHGEVVPGSKGEAWIAWATAQADRMDPLVESPPSIIDEKPKWEPHRYW